ncbi:hypothetical protein H0H93_013996 [Arthromyces matolae]|nr:hypothetical protein H0H93_013996 [Arthromyces matolae]
MVKLNSSMSSTAFSLFVPFTYTNNGSADLTTFRNAYGKYGNGLYVGLTVGNEVNDSPENIAGAVQHAKTVLGDLTVDISTVHVWVTVRDNPVLCQNVNFIGANAHAFYDGNTAAQDAGNFLQNTVIPSLTQACPNAHIIISETGWPSDGSPNGAAVPSFENEASAVASLNCAAKAEGAVSVYAFEYDDSTWKASQGADANEQSFGLYVKQQPTLLTAIAAVLMISC